MSWFRELGQRVTSRNAQRATLYKRVAWGLGLLGFAAFVACLVAYSWVLGEQGVSHQSENWGTFGDFVGGIAGTILALLTLIAIALTLHLQARELEDTRGELRNQTATAERQAFEVSFFRILENRQRTLAEYRYGASGSERLGRPALGMLAQSIAQKLKDQTSATSPAEDVAKVVDSAISSIRSEVDPLVGSTMQLLHFVNTAKAPDKVLDYKAIARADFSVADQVFLLFVGVSNYGKRFNAFETLKQSGVLAGLESNSFVVEVRQQLIDKYAQT